jgi:hypothetical protein
VLTRTLSAPPLGACFAYFFAAYSFAADTEASDPAGADRRVDSYVGPPATGTESEQGKDLSSRRSIFSRASLRKTPKPWDWG